MKKSDVAQALRMNWGMHGGKVKEDGKNAFRIAHVEDGKIKEFKVTVSIPKQKLFTEAEAGITADSEGG